MSKLIRKIEQLEINNPAPLGFGRKQQPSPTKTMLIVGIYEQFEPITQLASPYLDAVILQPNNAPSPDLVALLDKNQTPWGILVEEPTLEEIQALKEKGCDFLVFRNTEVGVDAFQDQELGRILLIPGDIPKKEARSLEDLPLDGVVSMDIAVPPFSISDLLALSTLRGEIAKPFILQLGSTPSSWELECLRNLGVECVVLDLSNVEVSTIETLHTQIISLPVRKGKADRNTLSISYSSNTSQSPNESDDDGDY